MLNSQFYKKSTIFLIGVCVPIHRQFSTDIIPLVLYSTAFFIYIHLINLNPFFRYTRKEVRGFRSNKKQKLQRGAFFTDP